MRKCQTDLYPGVIGVFGITLLLFLALAVLSGPGLAQSGEDSTPQTEQETDDDASGAPIGLIPLDDPEEGDEENLADEGMEAIRSQPGSEGTVSVGSLSKVSDRVYGLLEADQGGFGRDLWADSRRPIIERMMKKDLPVSSSVVLQDLTRRLLVSTARDPQGVSSGAAFLSLRLQQLYGSGRLKDIDAILSRSMQAMEEDGSADFAAKVALLQDDGEKACSLSDQRRSDTSIFWTKLRTYCFVLKGDRTSANLQVDLLTEEGYEDLSFLMLVLNLTDDAGLEIEPFKSPDPVDLAMMRQASIAPDGGLVDRASPSLLPFLASLYGVTDGWLEDPRFVLAASERAAVLGLMSWHSLAEAYLSFPVDRGAEQAPGGGAGESPGEPDQPPEDIAALDRAALNARIYRLVGLETHQGKQADYVYRVLEKTENTWSHPIIAGVLTPKILEIPIEESYAQYADRFVPVLISHGFYEEAFSWQELFADYVRRERRSQDVSSLERDLGNYWSLLRLADPKSRHLRKTWSAVGRLTDAKSNEDYTFVNLEVRLFEAAGFRLPDRARVLLLQRHVEQSGDMPTGGILSGLEAASRGGRKGETLLYLLKAFEYEGLSTAHPSTLVAAVSALRRIGLDKEARALALEALLARL